MPRAPGRDAHRTRVGAAVAVCLAVLLPSLGCKSCGCARQPSHPNVVIVLSDALRAASLPMYGYPRDTAPHLAALAREGVTFDSHLIHYPGTTVSVSQMQTGRLMPPLLISYKYIAVPVRGIPPDLLILPEAFRRAGYRTGIVSSHYWFRPDSELVPRFESRAIISATGDQSYAWFENLWPALTEFLDKSSEDDRPFFLYVHTLDTHGPNTYHPGFDQFRNASEWPEAYNVYDSEILYTDHWVGKLIDALRERDLLDNTIFVFTADHGEEFQEFGPEPWNGHHGPVLRRNLVHVPLIMRFPNDPAPGRRYQAVTRHIDLAPTLLRLAVPDAPLQPYRMDGEDLSGELRSGGTGAGIQRTSFAFTPRYWGLFQRDLELYYDQWTNTFSPLYRPVPNQYNYPMPQPVDDAATREQLMTELRQQQEAGVRDYAALPLNPHFPEPALLSLLLPTKPGAGGAPTFENLPDDNKWQVYNWIESQPGEHPDPLTLVTPWVPGKYRVTVSLHLPGIRAGYQNEFTLYFPHDGNHPVRLHGSDAQHVDLDAGVQSLGDTLEIQFTDPRGGVAIAGLKLERVDNGSAGVTPDDGLKERLRALGYVQ
jgi:arylsulfatase A-like enzyme